MTYRSAIINADTLARATDACCVLDSSLQFLYCNCAWDDFARANGGTRAAMGEALLHKRLLTYIPDILKSFYAHQFNILRQRGTVWYHRYECPSPREFAVYELQALLMHDQNEILICHSQIVRRPHTRPAVEPRGSTRNGGRPVSMCCHCRRTFRDDGSGAWDWIPAYVQNPPANYIACLCQPCTDYYQHGGDLVLNS